MMTKTLSTLAMAAMLSLVACDKIDDWKNFWPGSGHAPAADGENGTDAAPVAAADDASDAAAADTAGVYREAAEQGLASAQYDLALCYAEGRGVEQDERQAAGWFRKAADQDHAVSQYMIGLYYEQGKGGLKQDAAKAKRYYGKAAAQEVPEARFRLALLHYNACMETTVARNAMVPYWSRQAVDLSRKASEQGYAPATYLLGMCYLNGVGVRADGKEAVRYLEQAAAQGVAAAQYELGMFYLHGKGGKRDAAQAAKWLRMAAAQGHDDAAAKLAGIE